MSVPAEDAMSELRTLNQLQEIDQQITQVEQRLQTITAILDDDSVAQTLQQQITNAETTLKPLRTRARDLELEVDTTATKADETETHLYSGKVKNPKEMQEMQQELGLLQERQATLEEALLELMSEIEEQEDHLGDLNTKLEKQRKAREAENEMLVLEREAKQGNLVQLRDQRQKTADSISPSVITLYNQLRQRTRGTPIAQMSREGICARCGVKQNRSDETNVRRGILTQCNNCRRILLL